MPAQPTIQFLSKDPAQAVKWDGALRGEALLICDGTSLRTQLLEGQQVTRTWEDPLAALKWMAEDILAQPPDCRWCGFLGYDLGRLFERLPMRAIDDVNVPLFAFARGTWRRDRENEGGAEPVIKSLQAAARQEPRPPGVAEIHSTLPRPAFEAAVARAIDYIAAGDIFQVNLSQRFTVPARLSAEDAFARLNQSAGATYGALLQFDDFAIVSNSPELFLEVTPDRRVITRPIKGTRPRAPGMHEELLMSIKDQAELNMIIDLERNDLGRVCRIGSVRVSQPRTIEAHPTVYHGVATVEGRLRDDVGFIELLGATFPGGSITGAPKIRAMEIIEELEPVRRGAYCGAIGYLAPDGSMQFNLAIRTMTFKEGKAYIPVGGGIVADSSPAAEYEETIVKSRAMFAALGISCM